MYSSIIQKEDDEEEFSYKENLKERLKQRNRIKRELVSCLQEIRNTRYKNLKKTTILPCLKLLANVELLTRQITIPNNWDGCYKCEKRNIKLYYETLYSHKIPHHITNTLLHQKTQIEDYLHN